MEWQQQDTMYYLVPGVDGEEPKENIAAFDIDWTLSYSQHHMFGAEPHDIEILPLRLDRIRELYDMGMYTIALFTNQSAVKKDVIQKRLDRMANLVRKLGVPCYVFVATGSDKKGIVDPYRKPQRGMWDKLLEFVPRPKKAFFVGDAMGRPQDFSDCDLEFARACEIEPKTPEQYFGVTGVPFVQSPNGKDLVVFVGMPGCGKSSLYKEMFEPLGMRSVSQDVLKNRRRLLSKLEGLLEDGQSVVVDNTNPSQEKNRREYYDLAEKYGFNVTVIYFVRDGRGWNKLRPEEKCVPTIAYTGYFSRLNPPTEENTPGTLLLVT